MDFDMRYGLRIDSHETRCTRSPYVKLVMNVERPTRDIDKIDSDAQQTRLGLKRDPRTYSILILHVNIKESTENELVNKITGFSSHVRVYIYLVKKLTLV